MRKKQQPEPFDVGDFLRPTDTDLRSALNSLLHGAPELEPGPKLTDEPAPKSVAAIATAPGPSLSPPPATAPKVRPPATTGSPTALPSPLIVRPGLNILPAPAKRQFAVRPAHLVEDGHSRAEHQVYQALWENATPSDDTSRLITLGFASMGKLTGLSESNARINLRSLVQKLAIEEHTTYNCAASQGRTYRVFSAAEILRRRHAAGLSWVMRRTLAVVFVDPQTKTPLFTKTGSTSGPGPSLRPSLILTHAVRGQLQQYGPVDNETVQAFLDACPTTATPEQLAAAIQEQAWLTQGMAPAEAVAFILATVPTRLRE